MHPLLWISAWYLATSVVSFALYGIDKRRAARNRWRVPEARLHVIDLIGGWPGGMLGRRVFRHKRRKVSFMLVSWVIIGAHVALWTWILLGPMTAGDAGG